MSLVLEAHDLHASLQDETLGSVSFLNDVMRRYPDAISFAPGAPHPSLYDDVDVSGSVNRFVEYLESDGGLSKSSALRALYEYGPTKGLINELVASALAQDLGLCANPEAIVITVGAQEAMLLVLRALCRSPADYLAVVEPCYVGMIGTARVLGVPVVPVAEGPRGVDIDDMLRASARVRKGGGRIRAAYVAPDFANPSGLVMDEEARRELLDAAYAEDFLIIEDMAYGFTAAPAMRIAPVKALDGGDQVVSIGTFSKICMPGARVGFAVADQTVARRSGPTTLLADEMALIKGMTTVNTSPLCQALIGGLLLAEGGSLGARARATGARQRSRLSHLLDALDRELHDSEIGGRVTWNRPDGGFFVRMQLAVEADGELLKRCARAYKVLWTPMRGFFVEAGGERELRLSASYLDLATIDEGVRRLKAFVSSLPSTAGHGS
jgi:(S)-3,5-dihydroxyphenylglycine transaminase